MQSEQDASVPSHFTVSPKLQYLHLLCQAAWPSRWKLYGYSKRRYLLIWRYSVRSQETWSFNHTETPTWHCQNTSYAEESFWRSWWFLSCWRISPHSDIEGLLPWSQNRSLIRTLSQTIQSTLSLYISWRSILILTLWPWKWTFK